MATYRFGFYGFEELVLSGGAGAAAVHPVANPGSMFRLSRMRAVLTPLLVETRDAWATDGLSLQDVAPARIAAGSDFGLAGQAVGIACRLTTVGEGLPPHRPDCQLLTIDGSPVGLFASEPLRPGVTYRVSEATVTGPATGIDPSLGDFGHAVASATPAPPAEVVFCFTSGTRVDTPDGPRLIEDLAPGDLVTTLGNGSQPLRWIGLRPVPAAEMLLTSDLQPVEFAIGVIGNTVPLRVSPQHRILLNDWRAQVFFGEDEVLVPAKAMVNGRTVRQVLPAEGVTYVHLLFDRHEIIVSEGALSESFHPGDTGLLALDDAQRREIELLFPELELSRRRAAFPIVKLTEARAIRLPD